MDTNAQWPVLRQYDSLHLGRIALPLGGIGTGTVALGGRGNLQDWEIVNRPAKGFGGGEAIFVLYAREEGRPAVLRALEGVLQPPYEGASGATSPYHGLPRFRRCDFSAAYPLGQVMLSDADVPVEVRMEAFNPLVPADPDASGLPVAVLRYVLHNTTDRPVAATVCASLRNFVGSDGRLSEQGGGKPQGNVNIFRADERMRGLFMSSSGVTPGAEAFGTLALVTTAEAVTAKCVWPSEGWNASLLHFWDDLSQDGRLDDVATLPQDAPMGSLAAEVTLRPQGEETVTFLLAWHFPNRQTWTPAKECACGCETDCGTPNLIGNYYTTQFQDAWDAAQHAVARMPQLEDATLRFVRAFCESDLPAAVREAALFNLSTLRSQTCFRTPDGRFFGWEGCGDNRGCCHGSCTHVWNYEQATAFLFGSLASSMREVEFLHATDDQGLMSFRVNLPLQRAQESRIAAADGQMGCIMKAYRDWQLSGDSTLLARLWPKIKQALAFCWVPGGWDADRDGVMEGCQHNTLDVEYYGPNPLMAGWYLGALRAAERMARYLSDEAFAQQCRDLFAEGSAWVDAHLFNGEYYEQRITPPAEGQPVAEGLRVGMGARNLADPDFQVGPGCLVDQMVGQYMAHVCGLGYLFDRHHVRKTLISIYKYNYRRDLYGHFNNMRTFALNDEQALLMCSFPRGGRPKTPVPYFAEVMTGFEYAAAVHMLYEGQTQHGQRCIASIRARYDGQRRNPFDEAECGHHYARAMASWGAVLALTGFHYSAVEQSMTFAHFAGTQFWSNGYAWGTCRIAADGDGAAVTLTTLYGSLRLKSFALSGLGEVRFAEGMQANAGESVLLRISAKPA